MPTVKETFDAMASKFQPSKAAGINKTIQYDISGDQGGTWHAVIKEGSCVVNSGPATNPHPTPPPSLGPERPRYITGAVLTVTGGMDLFTF